MRFNEVIYCQECQKHGEACHHVGCDVDGFGGQMQECEVCHDHYYAQKNNAAWGSPVCHTCQQNAGSLKGMAWRKYHAAMTRHLVNGDR